jgi:RecA-family ATPase
VPLSFVSLADWDSQGVPARQWAVLDRVPSRNVTLFSGEGAAGKSQMLQQLLAGTALGRSWLDTMPEPGPALYLNAEDELGEVHRRLDAIRTFHGVSFADLRNLHLLCLAGQDAVLGAADRTGAVKPTPLFQRIREAACDIRPKIIGLDTAADIFAGNENDRTQVRQFVGLLRGLAMNANAAVVVCSHPSLTGINSGSGLSGSTAWHNSVRARIYMKTATTSRR